ncbi:cell adhesion molecule 2-like [Argopecten irradians]|uniref:cell adhesion molecule 2-like n=1 Tax=Argopecten irradians TaxID=31199 RepID=UPI0037149639
MPIVSLVIVPEIRVIPHGPGSEQSPVFIVRFGPDSVSITGNKVVVADGTNTLTLTCTTQEYNRHVHITWYNGTTRIPNTAVVTNTSGSYVGFISTQVLQLVPDRYQDGNVVRCVVQNEDVTLGERTASVTLDINYLPSTPVTVSVDPTTEGQENSVVDLTCHVTGGKPIPSLQWTCPPTVTMTTPTTGSQGDRHTSVITVTLTRQANGQTCTCTGSQSDTTWTGSEQSQVFIARFGPDSISINR